MNIKPFKVKVYHGVTTHHLVVWARSADEVFEEALRVLKLSHKDVRKMNVEAVER